jgi:hypothetical protein
MDASMLSTNGVVTTEALHRASIRVLIRKLSGDVMAAVYN